MSTTPTGRRTGAAVTATALLASVCAMFAATPAAAGPGDTGSISGIVTQEGGGPLAEVCLEATIAEAAPLTTETALDGTYTFAELADGSYEVSASPCEGDTTPPNVLNDTATVPVAGGAPSSHDVELLVGGAIEGTVTSSELGNAPVEGVCVEAITSLGGTGSVSTTDASGAYRLERLDSDLYTVAFSACEFDGVSWAYAASEPVEVTRPDTVTGIDAVLDPGAQIVGTVTNTTGAPVQGMCLDTNGAVTFRATTSAAGTYAIQDLPAGTYSLVVGDCFQTAYVEQTIGGLTLATGGEITQDVVLALYGRIHGDITGTDDACVSALDATSAAVVDTTCTIGGGYELKVPPGDIKVRFTNNDNNETQWFGGLDEGTATVLSVDSDETIEDIDAAFTPADQPPTVALVNPSSGAAVKGIVNLTATADDDFGVASVEFLVDGVPVGTDIDGSDGWSVRWNSAAIGDGQSHSFTAAATDTIDQFGTDTISAMVRSSTKADFDGDGDTEIAVFRPSTGMWWIRGVRNTQWGEPGDIPVPADYNGDGTTETAIYRPSTRTWWIKGMPAITWGDPTDIPVPQAPRPGSA